MAAAYGGTPRCKAHGGGKRCQEEDCNKHAQGGTGFCIGHGGGKRCRQPGSTQSIAAAASSVSCKQCLQRAQLDDAEEVAPPQSDTGQPAAAGGDSCSTVAWEEPGEEVTQEL